MVVSTIYSCVFAEQCNNVLCLFASDITGKRLVKNTSLFDCGFRQGCNRSPLCASALTNINPAVPHVHVTKIDNT